MPNYSTGEATIIDLVAMRVVAQRQLFDHPMRFELLTRDGFVFFNDPDSNRAGVLDLSGNVRTITKHDQPYPGSGIAPTSDTHTQQNQPGHDRKRKQGPGIAQQATESSQPLKAPPPPSVSIVVKPRSHGLVGDQFELTLVSQPPSSITEVHWQFGDGTEATGATVNHGWQQPGTFPVRAAATFTTGTQPTIAQTTVTVDPPGAPPRIKQLSIRRPTPVIGEKVHFGAEVTGAPDKWAWAITKPGGPNSQTTADTPEFDHAFTTPGTYNVTLTITTGTHTTRTSRPMTVALGSVRAWGENYFKQVSVPPQAISGVVVVTGGTGHSLALKADGSVIGWGDNFAGQASPIPPQATSGVVAIAAGTFHSLALKTDGSVIGWGDNYYDQISIPPQATSGVIAIAAGSFYSLALKTDGSVIGWGDNLFGQISIPPQATSGVVAIAASSSDDHGLALKADGSVVGWGNNTHGQVSVPPQATSGVVAISTGSSFSLALKADGSVVGWGEDSKNQLSIPPQATSGVVAIAAGANHSLALKADGSVIGWGNNNYGQLSIPQQATSGVLAIATGDFHSLVC